MNVNWLTQKECKHDVGFKFIHCTAADRLPGVWVCLGLCGFSLRFDPEAFHGVTYLPHANPELGDKTLVIPASNGRG